MFLMVSDTVSDPPGAAAAGAVSADIVKSGPTRTSDPVRVLFVSTDSATAAPASAFARR